MKYLYNGVKLPALPEYDTEAYPYAVIVLFLTNGGYGLACSNRPFWVVNAYGREAIALTVDSEVVAFTCASGDEGWQTAEGVFDPHPDAVWEYMNPSVSQYVWTHKDILRESSTEIVYYGSEPVPFEWQKYFLTGLALGLTGKPLPFTGAPVAYLYNGVRLPTLPERDKSVYPYAYIYKGSLFTGGISYHLHLTSEPYYATSTSGNWCVGRRAGDISYWWYEGLSESFGYRTEWTNEGVMAEMYNLVWADFDVLDIDGTVALAASEPVPVYE